MQYLQKIYDEGIYPLYVLKVEEMFNEWKKDLTKSDLDFMEFITPDLIDRMSEVAAERVYKLYTFKIKGVFV